MLTQREWELQNKPIIKNGVLPLYFLTTLFLKKLKLSIRISYKLLI